MSDPGITESTEAFPPYEGPEFVIVLRDGADRTVEMAAAAKPEQLVEGSPAHLIGSFVCRNFQSICAQAQQELAEKVIAKRQVIGGDRERTLIVPDDSYMDRKRQLLDDPDA